LIYFHLQGQLSNQAAIASRRANPLGLELLKQQLVFGQIDRRLSGAADSGGTATKQCRQLLEGRASTKAGYQFLLLAVTKPGGSHWDYGSKANYTKCWCRP
jgi:hypothetical protein